MKHTFIEPIIDSSQYKLGASNVPLEILHPQGDYTQYLPDPEIQNKRGLETFDCTGFNTLNAIEMIMFVKFGMRVNYSDRWVGIIAGTDETGNEPHKVAEAIRKYGLIPEEMLPWTDDITTVDEYYSFKGLTQEQIDKCYIAGKQWLDRFDFRHEWVFDLFDNKQTKIKKMKEALKYSPLALSVYAWFRDERGIYVSKDRPNHWTSCFVFNEETILSAFDSYDPFVKRVEQEIAFCKRYYIEYRSKVQEMERNSIMKILLAIGQALGLIQKQIQELPKSVPPSPKPIELPQVDKNEALYELSKSLIGKHLSLDERVPKELGCCQALSFVLNKAGYPIPRGGISGTATMKEWLDKNFTKVQVPRKGSIVLYVTGTGITGSRGHVFVQGEYQRMSNDSRTGLWKAHWDIKASQQYYEGTLKMKPHVYDPK